MVYFYLLKHDKIHTAKYLEKEIDLDDRFVRFILKKY